MSNLLGENLKQYRKEARYSQRQLAEDTGVSREVIANWESGRTLTANLYDLVPIARVLNLHVAALMPDLDPERAERIRLAKIAVGKALRELDDALGRVRG